MEALISWFILYWPYVIGLILVCIAAFFVFRAAVRAYRKYYDRYRSEEEKIKRLTELKNKYAQLTKEAIESSDETELLEGAALSYQLKLQKSDNMEADFAALSKEKQYIYALDVFVQDGSLRTFFKENGSILTEKIVPALDMIGLHEVSEYTEKIRIMFDENDETTSIDNNAIEKIENKFSDGDFLTKIKLSAAEYIKKNTEMFV